MDKAPAYEAGDSRFEPWRGHWTNITFGSYDRDDHESLVEYSYLFKSAPRRTFIVEEA